MRSATYALGRIVILALFIVGLNWVREPPQWHALLAAARERGWSDVRPAVAECDVLFRLRADGLPDLAVRRYRPTRSVKGGLLFVHGNRAEGSGRAVYRILCRELSRRGFDVWAMDLRGYGLSDPAPPRSLTADDLTADVERVMRHMTAELRLLPLGLVGHSIGALITMQIELPSRWRAVALEPGVNLRARVIDRNGAELEAFTRKLTRVVRGARIDPGSVRSLYEGLDPERRSTGKRLLIVQGRNADERIVRGAPRIASMKDGATFAWTSSGDHEYGVREIGRLLVYPASVILEVTDRITEHLVPSP